MVKDQQVKELRKMLNNNKTLKQSAMACSMDEKTARKYRDSEKLPSEYDIKHTWKTREDPFKYHWIEIKRILENAPGVEGVTVFNYLQRTYPGYYQDGQLRTLQRKIKQWRATEGPPKEVMFTQNHPPGELGQSDFTSMNSLEITINGQPFSHLVFHFVLTYSNWENGSICFSESFESLSDGLQKALWNLGGIPLEHQTDRLTAAVNNSCNPEEFTQRYKSLMGHYSIKPRRINAGKSNENGDVEQSHYRFKKHVEQELLLRGSRNFNNREEYNTFIQNIIKQRNKGRSERFEEELKHLKPLPSRKLDAFKKSKVRVSRSSTVLVNHNFYSVPSRLIGENVLVYVYAEYIEIYYSGKKIDRIPRLKGQKKCKVQYRHVIDSLIRKPGAFKNYKYQSEMFPDSRFKKTYDRLLLNHTPQKAAKEYLKMLNLAAKENEGRVSEILFGLLLNDETPYFAIVEDKYFSKPYNSGSFSKTEIEINEPVLSMYDALLNEQEGEKCNTMN